jgi:hypothetical protein
MLASAPPKTLAQINHEALRLLYTQLGVVDTIRFINQFTLGHGDYTKQRQELLQDWTLDDIFEALETRPKPKRNISAPTPQTPTNH